MSPSPIPPELPESGFFDYNTLDPETRIFVQQRASEIKRRLREAARTIWEIGQNLVEVRDRLEFGQFHEWLRAEFRWSRSTAYNYINVFVSFGSCPNFGQLDIALSALYLLAKSSTPEEARREALERAAQGETITPSAAKAIVAFHTIDIEAETVAEEEQPPIPVQSTPKVVSPAPPNPEQASEELHSPAEPYQAGGRVRILCRQHGKDKWSGKVARIREITSDGQLRVDVEGQKGVRFTLNPDWVEPMETPESYKVQPKQASISRWADEPDPESPVIAGSAAEELPASQPPLQLQAGDRLRLANLGQSGQQWVGEVAEVIEVAEDRVQVIIEIPRQLD